jgi:hypothetical protein
VSSFGGQNRTLQISPCFLEITCNTNASKHDTLIANEITQASRQDSGTRNLKQGCRQQNETKQSKSLFFAASHPLVVRSTQVASKPKHRAS